VNDPERDTDLTTGVQAERVMMESGGIAWLPDLPAFYFQNP